MKTITDICNESMENLFNCKVVNIAEHRHGYAIKPEIREHFKALIKKLHAHRQNELDQIIAETEMEETDE